MSYCEFCDCPSCEDAQRQEQRKETMRRRCSRWNWNASPAEVAREIVDDDLYMPEVRTAMKSFGFSEWAINSVDDAVCAIQV